MKRHIRNFATTALFTLCALGVHSVQAANQSIDQALESTGDLSMFYQAMVNTGMIDELRDDQHYTIFAPTNAAFRDIRPELYPCFYAVECRPQIAALLREHIVSGGYGLNKLVSYGGGVQTTGVYLAKVEEPYSGDYTVDGIKILSRFETNGNVIYRINGVIADRKTLAQFQTVNYVPPEGTTIQKTVTTTTDPDLPENTTETVTVIRRTSVEP